MEELQTIMQIIDRHSDSIPEGDYLELCNRMRKLYKSEGECKTIFDYEEPMRNVLGITNDDVYSTHFLNHYLDTSVSIDRMFLENQIEYLTREEEYLRPLKRISKTIRVSAIKHYCNMNNIRLEQYTPEDLKHFQENTGYVFDHEGLSFKNSLKKLYKYYMFLENNYRHRIRVLLNNRIDQFISKLDDLEDI